MATLYIDVNNETHNYKSTLFDSQNEICCDGILYFRQQQKNASNGVHFSDEVILQLNANTSKINI